MTPPQSSMHEEPTPASARRRYALTAAKVAISAALLVYLFSHVDAASLWAGARRASVGWLAAAMGLYAINVLTSAWRWDLLLDAQGVHLPRRRVLGSILVANFFNNFLPSSIGGDVIRIRDTAKPARSKTLATIIVLTDRALGLMGLVFVSALCATAAAEVHRRTPLPVWPSSLWAMFFITAAATAPAVVAPDAVGRLLRPLAVLHPEWIGGRIETLTATLGRFRDRPAAIVNCLGGAMLVQALVVLFYLAVAHALHSPITALDLAVIVPVSLVVQMLPFSINGLGIREATFAFYFSRIGLPIESAVLMSLVAAALIMLFSLTGAVVYVSRGH